MGIGAAESVASSGAALSVSQTVDVGEGSTGVASDISETARDDNGIMPTEKVASKARGLRIKSKDRK